MAYFAVLNKDVVENTIVADSKSIAEQITERECIEYSVGNIAAIGYSYNRETGLFINPEPEPEE